MASGKIIRPYESKNYIAPLNPMAIGTWHNIFPFRTDSSNVYVNISGCRISAVNGEYNPSSSTSISVNSSALASGSAQLVTGTRTVNKIVQYDWGIEVRLTLTGSESGWGLVILAGTLAI